MTYPSAKRTHADQVRPRLLSMCPWTCPLPSNDLRRLWTHRTHRSLYPRAHARNVQRGVGQLSYARAYAYTRRYRTPCVLCVHDCCNCCSFKQISPGHMRAKCGRNAVGMCPFLAADTLGAADTCVGGRIS